jgi:transposase
MIYAILGVDLGIRAPSVAVLADEQGRIVGETLRFELSVEEMERVERTILAGAPEGAKLHVVMEKTYPTCEYVSSFFKARGHNVSFAKTDQVKKFRKCLSPKVKTDERDAYVMARLPYLDPKQLERGHMAAPALRVLKKQVSQRISMVGQLVTLKNQLIGYANAVWPGVSQALGDLDSAHARSLLREQTPKKVLNAGEQSLAEYLRKKEEIELDRTHTIELLEMVEMLEERIRIKEREINKTYLRCDPDQHLTSIPGIAEKTAPTIFSYFGQPERFATSCKAQGFVGLFPETDSSGTKDRKGTRITKQGPALLRRDLFLVADHFRRLDPQGAQLYHDQMVNKGKHHNSALCVVANRMLIPRVLVVMREQRPYELRDFEGNAIDKRQARHLAAQFKVPDDVRQRLRSQKKRIKKESREGHGDNGSTRHPCVPQRGAVVK